MKFTDGYGDEEANNAKAVFRKYGWPEENYNKDECMVLLEKVNDFPDELLEEEARWPETVGKKAETFGGELGA